jgi:hypothetical protein
LRHRFPGDDRSWTLLKSRLKGASYGGERNSPLSGRERLVARNGRPLAPPQEIFSLETSCNGLCLRSSWVPRSGNRRTWPGWQSNAPESTVTERSRSCCSKRRRRQ